MKEQMVIRMDGSLKAEIQKMAEESRRKTSDYIRLVMEHAIKEKVRV